jgi:hypothetical protein
MAGSTGPGSGMMIMVILLLLLSSSASAGGGYFYTNQEDTKEKVEDEFKLKYQEAARALEAERAAQQNVNVARTALELAQDELEIARLAFEGKEFANEAEKSAARARLYAAEQDVDTAAFRLSEAETDAQTAASRRDTAEENANAALRNAITINTMIEANAVADANVMVTLAQGELEAAQRDWERIIGDANAAAANVIIAASGEAQAAYSRLEAARDNNEAAGENLDTAEKEFAAAEKRVATALIGAAEDLAVDIGAGNAVTCSANDPVGATGAVYRVDGATNVLRHYPNPDIAASWDPNWASAEPIDCIGFVKGDDMPKNPAAVAAEAFAARVADLGVGNPVRCDTADVPGGVPGAVYRTTGTTTLRHYPDPDIADSWDPDWRTTTQGIDCTGFVKGDNMAMEPAAATAAFDAAVAAAVAAAPVVAPARPVMTTGTGGPHNGGIVWQSHDIGGRFHSPPGLVWLGGNTSGAQAWNQSYKFRCENNGSVSSFSPTYGPVNFRTYHKPKIQVSDAGTAPCNTNEKLEVWDANTENNITSQMKNFTGTDAYNGTDNSFWDPRDVGTTLAAPTGNCRSKEQGPMGDQTCVSLTGWDCQNRSTCELV